MILGLLGVSAVNASAAPARKKLTLLQQGLNYYKGKTITLTLGTAAGSAQDIQNRALLPTLDAYLHATVNIVDNSSGSGIAAANSVAASLPNGLTIGLLKAATPLYAIATGATALNFNPAHVVFLGGYPSPASPATLLTRASSGYQTFASLLAATAANPVPICVVTGTQADVNLVIRMFNIHARLIAGYSSSTNAVLGLTRGDCAAFYSTINTSAPQVQAGTFVAVAVNERFTGASVADIETPLIANTPTIAELIKRYPPTTKLQIRAYQVMQEFDAGSGNMFYAPTRTPAAEVAALRRAFSVSIKSKAMHTLENLQGDVLGFVNGTTAKANYLKGLKVVQRDSLLLTTP